MNIELKKDYTRSFGLYWFEIWSQAEFLELKKYLGVSYYNSLFVNDGNKDNKTTIWISDKDNDDVFGVIEKKIKEDPDFFQKIVDDFYKYWDLIKGLYTSQESFISLAQLDEFFDNAIKWWVPLSLLFIIPEIDSLSDEQKEKAIEARKDYERYGDNDNIHPFLLERFPELKGYIKYISKKEISSLGDEGVTENLIYTLEERKLGYVIFRSELYSYSQLKDVLENNEVKLIEEEIDPNIKEVKGQVASKGVAQGVVKVVLNDKQLENVNDGDIIVTEMTTPKFIPAMKKAVAFVTDEGGITCHAAIIARELGKPCIIGTKIATKVLKDGMEVEVDADNGIVKILNK